MKRFKGYSSNIPLAISSLFLYNTIEKNPGYNSNIEEDSETIMGKKTITGILLTAIAGFSSIAVGCGGETVKKDEPRETKTCVATLEQTRSVDPLNLPETEVIFENMVKLPNGDVYLLDGRNVKIVKIDATGKQTASFLKKGEGPGEFGTYPKLQLLDGHLWVIGRKKVGKFTLDGVLVKEVQLKKFYGSLQMIDDSRFIATRDEYAAGPNTSNQFVKYVGLFNLESEVLEHRFTEAPGLGRLFVDTGSKMRMAFIPGPQVLTDFVIHFDRNNQELLISKTDDYLIQSMSLSGEQKRRMSLPHTPIPLIEEGKQEVVDRFSGIPEHIKQAVIKALPQTLPALMDFEILENGNILVKRIAAVDKTELDMLDNTGAFICQLQLPLNPNTIQYKIKNNTLLTIEEQEDRNIYYEYKITGIPQTLLTNKNAD